MMRDRDDLRSLRGVVRLRDAQRQAARIEAFRCEAALAEAEVFARRTAAEREAAEAWWRESLERSAPDVGLIRLAGDWLVQREQGAAAARLDESIAQGRHGDALAEAVRAGARLSAAESIAGRVARRLARADEERLSRTVEDMVLARGVS